MLLPPLLMQQHGVHRQGAWGGRAHSCSLTNILPYQQRHANLLQRCVQLSCVCSHNFDVYVCRFDRMQLLPMCPLPCRLPAETRKPAAVLLPCDSHDVSKSVSRPVWKGIGMLPHKHPPLPDETRKPAAEACVYIPFGCVSVCIIYVMHACMCL